MERLCMTDHLNTIGLNIDNIATRFFNHTTVLDAGQCWPWRGATTKGYGIMSSRRGKSPLKVHRVSYYLHFGEIPGGMVVRHTCDNPRCVNPLHLKLGTQKDNAQDASLRNRLNPKSMLNLRPGHPGYYGAGPKSLSEILNE